MSDFQLPSNFHCYANFEIKSPLSSLQKISVNHTCLYLTYMEVFDFTTSKHLPYKVRTCMIDGNILQNALRGFDFEGRVAVKLMVI